MCSRQATGLLLGFDFLCKAFERQLGVPRRSTKCQIVGAEVLCVSLQQNIRSLCNTADSHCMNTAGAPNAKKHMLLQYCCNADAAAMRCHAMVAGQQDDSIDGVCCLYSACKMLRAEWNFKMRQLTSVISNSFWKRALRSVPSTCKA